MLRSRLSRYGDVAAGAGRPGLALLPQGDPERTRRAASLVRQMNAEALGNCSNEGECEAVCPKEISLANIARMRREYWRALLFGGW